MIRVIGSPTCSRCIAVKNALDRKGVKYSYLMIDELEESDREYLLNRATQKKMRNMPIIEKDGEITDLQGVLT